MYFINADTTYGRPMCVGGYESFNWEVFRRSELESHSSPFIKFANPAHSTIDEVKSSMRFCYVSEEMKLDFIKECARQNEIFIDIGIFSAYVVATTENMSYSKYLYRAMIDFLDSGEAVLFGFISKTCQPLATLNMFVTEEQAKKAVELCEIIQNIR